MSKDNFKINDIVNVLEPVLVDDAYLVEYENMEGYWDSQTFSCKEDADEFVRTIKEI